MTSPEFVDLQAQTLTQLTAGRAVLYALKQRIEQDIRWQALEVNQHDGEYAAILRHAWQQKLSDIESEIAENQALIDLAKTRKQLTAQRITLYRMLSCVIDEIRWHQNQPGEDDYNQTIISEAQEIESWMEGIIAENQALINLRRREHSNA